MRHAEAGAAINRAIDASPNFAYAHGVLGAVHAFVGQPDQAIECIDRCVRLSPRDIFGHEHQLYYAFAHFQAGRYAEAAAAAQLSLRQRPDHPVPYIIAAAAHGLGGETAEASRMIARLADLVPGLSAADVEETFLYARPEDRRRVAAGLRAASLAR